MNWEDLSNCKYIVYYHQDEDGDANDGWCGAC